MSTKRFFGLFKPRIGLAAPEGTPRELAPPKRVCIPLAGGASGLKVGVGDPVQGGQLLAVATGLDPVYAPFGGQVVAISEGLAAGGATIATLELETGPEPAWIKANPLEDLSAADADALTEAMDKVGVALPWEQIEGSPKSILVMAVDREPGLGVQRYFLTAGLDELKTALGLLQRLAGSVPIKLAVPASFQGQLSGIAGLKVLPVPERYPDSHWRLILAKACGTGNITYEGARQAGHYFLTAEHLCLALRAVKAGLPRTTKLVTVAGKGLGQPALVETPLGTPVGHLLEELGIMVAEGDRVILGGVWQGEAQFDRNSPVTLGTDGVTVIAADELTHLKDNPCIHCGRCVSICPVNIQVGLVARYAEFALVDEAYTLGAHACIECGCCAHVCPAQRPLLQYMRYAIEQYEAAQAAAEEAGAEPAASTAAQEWDVKTEAVAAPQEAPLKDGQSAGKGGTK